MIYVKRDKWLKSKTKLKNQIKANGNWRQFVEIRQGYMKRGIMPALACIYAAERVEEDLGYISRDLIPSMNDVDRFVKEGSHLHLFDRTSDNYKIVRDKMEERGEIGEITRETFEGKSAPPAEAVKWAVNNLRTKGVTAKHAPSSAAWTFLCWARENPSNEKYLLGSIWPRILPSRAQMDEQSMHKDDGAAVLDLIGRIQTGMEEKGLIK